MRPFIVNYLGQTIRFDADMLMVLAVERMERAQCRPHNFLYAEHENTFHLTVFDYLRETDIDITAFQLNPLFDYCVKTLKADRRFCNAILALHIDDSDWTGSLCRELRESVVADFTAHFPQYHNLARSGLIDREV